MQCQTPHKKNRENKDHDEIFFANLLANNIINRMEKMYRAKMLNA